MTVVKVFADEKGQIFLRCPFCNNSSLHPAKLFPIHETVIMSCSCGKAYEFQIETRKEYRKKTNLAGFYVKQDLDSAFQPMAVIDLTLRGCCFLAPDNHGLHKGEEINVSFRLDNPQQTRIKRNAVILRIQGNIIGCRLLTGAYDPELGFYVQDFKVLS